MTIERDGEDGGVNPPTASEKSRWQQEFDALPEWAKKMVLALKGSAYYGFGKPRMPTGKKDQTEFRLSLDDKLENEWFDGFCDMKELAAALTAPWPPPPPPERGRRAFNIVELVADGEDCAFDQPCCFGHRVEFHAVYCHNEAWPDSPRKCRRNRDDYRHEDCPGFVTNPDFKASP